jgi:deoxyribodipyrimidine photo-lyase
MSNDDAPVLVWFRNDLRLDDHPALRDAVSVSDAVVPIFVWAPDEEEPWTPGRSARWWLRESLDSLADDLEREGLELICRRGGSEETLLEVADAVGARTVVWNERVAPHLRERDERVAEQLENHGLDVETFESRILHDPDSVETTSGGPYHVYTPFWKKFQKVVDVRAPVSRPDFGATTSPTDALDSLEPGELFDVDGGELSEHWTPGESAARERLQTFVDGILAGYETSREIPGEDGTSRLSPRLQHGELSPAQVWEAIEESAVARDETDPDSVETYLEEIVWREFSYHLLHHYPETTTEPLKEKFEAFEWRWNDAQLERWKRGETGYPIVDAGMRQLKETGWMHNRVRMIAGSFLTKDLLLPWQEGARWFWEHLVDADLASNTMGWQWAAGCGADAQPFFRMFNPVSQSERYDSSGAYIRRWVPELRALPDDAMHEPWEADRSTLAEADVVLGEDYPTPIVDHGEARERALEEWRRIK